jgi:hypothetical protein
MANYFKTKHEQFTLGNTPSYEKTLFELAISSYPPNGDFFRMIEIGVLDGETSSFLLAQRDDMILYGIDPIIPDSMEASLIGSVDKIFENTKPFWSRFRFIKDYSTFVHNQFEDGTIDAIFIDGDHRYEAVKEDYELYFPKIKSGGLIFFHDSRMYRDGAPFHVGSSQFVSEIIDTDTNIELVGEAFSLTCFKKRQLLTCLE